MNVYKILAIGLATATMASCANMTEMSLYDAPTQGEAHPMDKFGAPVVYGGTKSDENWSTPAENDQCATIDWEYPSHPTDPDGKSIHVQWDRNKAGCDWMGIGFGWNKWQAKDLSAIIDHAALEVWIMAPDGPTTNVRMVPMFEDYAEKNAASGFNMLGIDHEVKNIDTVWKRIVMPLSAFGFNTAGFDKQSIKQLKFEFQSAGHFVIGPITIIKHKSEFKKLEDGTKGMVMTKPEYQIYSDEQKYQWGIRPKFCDSYTYGTDKPFEGSQYIKVDRTDNGCDWADFGLNWSQWAPIDMSDITDKTALRFMIRAKAETPTIPLKFGFSSWADWQVQYFDIKPEYLEKGKLTTNWQQVTIPLSGLKLAEKGVGMHAVKALAFQPGYGAQLDIDDIQLIPFQKTSGNPFSRYAD